MSPVLVRSDRPSAARGDRGRQVAVAVVAAIAVVVLLDGLALLVRGPAVVRRVTLENRTPHLVDVEVTDGARHGWLGLAALQPGERLDVHEVVDQGDRWVFHFTSGHYDGGETQLARDDLDRGGWHVTVGADVEARLVAQGASPAPG